MPIDLLKIDQSFVQDLTTNVNNAAICRVIIGIASSIHVDVIAEGVETLDQLNMLGKLGCKRIQGYLVSKPVPAVDFEHLLKRGWLFLSQNILAAC